MKHYDAILIGSGQASNPLAFRLATKGWKVALVEKKHIGGVCVNEGCTPTKVMVGSAKAAFMASRGNEFGFTTDEIKMDINAIISRKNNVVSRFRNGLEKSLKEHENIDVIYGEASFTGIKQIAVLGKEGHRMEYSADYIFINTGARASIPSVKGLDGIPFFTSSSIIDIAEIPEHLIIIGAGVIGIEFAQVFRRFGSRVTMLSRASRLLQNEDMDVSEEIKEILEAEAIAILTNCKVEYVEKNSNGSLAVAIEENNIRRLLNGSHILVATGRLPNTDTLHAENAGIDVDDRGYIKVNDKLETTATNIYALGDVKGGPAFTHISYNDYLIVYKNIVEQANITIKNRPVPYCIFTDPELARIGISEHEAHEQQLPIKVAKLPMTRVARAIEAGETKGFIKAIVHAETKQILGAVVIGSGGAEIMSLLQIAMLGGITASQLAENIFVHPSYAEALNNLFNTI